MKRVFLKGIAVALLLTAAVVTVNAQPQGGRRGNESEKVEQKREEATPEQKATKITEMMKSRLNLTEAQAKKLYAENLDYIKKLEEAKKLKAKHYLNILDILDDDQSIIYLDMLSKSKNRGGGREGERPAENKEGERRGPNPKRRGGTPAPAEE